jgi:radical SAM-linked protein
MDRFMVSDPPSTAPVTADPAGCVRDKVRIRFVKGGDLRLLSHHDLMRTFERMLRRADLPFRRTQGFHPKPRLVFALSLPLGVVGRDEVVELELDQELPPEEIHDRLARQAPAGLSVTSVRRIDPRAGAQVRGLCYRVSPLPITPELRARVADVLAAAHCWVERTRPPRRRLDLRPFLCDLRLGEAPAGEPRAADPFLDMDLWLTPAGTARPDELLGVLGLQGLVDTGAVCERTRLDLVDETPLLHAEGIA